MGKQMIPKHLTPAPYQIKWRLLRHSDDRKRQHMSLAVDPATSRVHISCPNNIAMPKQKALLLADILVDLAEQLPDLPEPERTECASKPHDPTEQPTQSE